MLIQAFFFALVCATCFADPAKIVRPCKLAHRECISKNLARNSNCNLRVRGSLPKAYRLPQFTFHTPAFNASYTDYNLIIKNHNLCQVSEFFFNLQSNTVVLGIDCPRLQFQSTRKLIQHSSLREDSEFIYDYDGTYPLIRLTLNLKGTNGLNICDAIAFADVTALPTYNINPYDRKTANFLSRDLTKLGIFEMESIWWRANLLARYYVNSILCDFGCDF